MRDRERHLVGEKRQHGAAGGLRDHIEQGEWLVLRILLKLSSLVASSWSLSWCLHRLRGLRLVGPPRESVWYFAYGANMHDSAFRGWRGMRPLEWRPARVHGYR